MIVILPREGEPTGELLGLLADLTGPGDPPVRTGRGGLIVGERLAHAYLTAILDGRPVTQASQDQETAATTGIPVEVHRREATSSAAPDTTSTPAPTDTPGPASTPPPPSPPAKKATGRKTTQAGKTNQATSKGAQA